jgi:uncharacterized protein (DUF2267 family)
MVLDFEDYAEKGNEYLNDVTIELGIQGNRERAARIIISCLLGIRKVITVEESVKFLAQLPMALKAVYADGWKLTRRKKIRNEVTFLGEILWADGTGAWKDFGSIDEMREALLVVVAVLSKHVSPGQLQEMQALVPKALRPLFTEGMARGFAGIENLNRREISND